MSEKKKAKEWQPKIKPAAVVKPGPRPPADTSEIPDLEGPTVLLNFRIDQRTADLIQEHFDRLTRMTGTAVTRSDTLRSLIHKGAQAYRAEQQPQEDSDK